MYRQALSALFAFPESLQEFCSFVFVNVVSHFVLLFSQQGIDPFCYHSSSILIHQCQYIPSVLGYDGVVKLPKSFGGQRACCFVFLLDCGECGVVVIFVSHHIVLVAIRS